MNGLPIDEKIPEILRRLETSRNLVIEAPPGAGKTTRVPPALLPPEDGSVLVLEPRRIAARMAARRVAAELGEQPGRTAGYQVRFETNGGPETRLWFLTEGVLTRRLASGDGLSGVSAVILDEFHERRLEGDLALTLLERLQSTARPDLSIVVMSATLDAAPVARFLGGCPRIASSGRLYPVDVGYTPQSAVPLDSLVAAALDSLLREGLDGDVLVFLPGAAEIRAAMRSCSAPASRAGIELLPLHGDLSPEEQDRAIEPGAQRKVILSTNVAESSITIEGVSAVIDSGLARVAEDSPWTGLPTLRVARVSRASADQRAGRAGRLRPGRVIRLYPEADFVRRPAFDTPEILRRELSQVLLSLHLAGAGEPERVRWLDPPPFEAVAAARRLLIDLGALDPGGSLTPEGRRMARLPLPPRLSRLLIEADRRGAGEEGCAAAAALSAGERLPPGSEHSPGPSDLLAFLEGRQQSKTRRLTAQIRHQFRPRPGRGGDEALQIAALCAFPDRVALRRRGSELVLAGGGGAILAKGSSVRRGNLLVALDIEERREHGLPLVRLASAIQAEWLLDLFPERITEREEVIWNREQKRVEKASALLFDQIPIEESRGGEPDPETASRLLAEKAMEAGPGRFADQRQLDALRNRTAFAAAHGDILVLDEQAIRETFEQLCHGLRSFRELTVAARNGGLLEALKARLSPAQRKLLDEIAPEYLRLPAGRRMKIHYEPGKPPWASSRLQDFFGMTRTPTVARGAVPLVLHLLAPNMRPVQTTTDLAGFWERLYPQVRRELRRRYPKHAWPENPL